MITIKEHSDDLNVNFKLYQEEIKILHICYPFMCENPSFITEVSYLIEEDAIIANDENNNNIVIPITIEQYHSIVELYNDCFGNIIFKVPELLMLLRTLTKVNK